MEEGERRGVREGRRETEINTRDINRREEREEEEGKEGEEEEEQMVREEK